MRIALIIFSFLLVPVAGGEPASGVGQQQPRSYPGAAGAAQEASLASQMEGRIVALPKNSAIPFVKVICLSHLPAIITRQH